MSKRLGMMTGKVYDLSVDPEDIHECCVVISDSTANNQDRLDELRTRYRAKCDACPGDPGCEKGR